MVRVKSPLFSQKASKQLGKSLIYKTKSDRCFVTRYNKPGGQNPFTPSNSQTENRELYGETVGVWRDKTSAQKAYWNALALFKNLKISGWNYFYKMAFEDPEGYLGTAFYGIRQHGYFKYGKIVLE